MQTHVYTQDERTHRYTCTRPRTHMRACMHTNTYTHVHARACTQARTHTRYLKFQVFVTLLTYVNCGEIAFLSVRWSWEAVLVPWKLPVFSQNLLELRKASTAGSSKKLQKAITAGATLVPLPSEVGEIVVRNQARLKTMTPDVGADLAAHVEGEIVMNLRKDLQKRKRHKRWCSWTDLKYLKFTGKLCEIVARWWPGAVFNNRCHDTRALTLAQKLGMQKPPKRVTLLPK